MPPESRADHRLITAAAALRRAVSALRFDAPVAFVYNPLDYAWAVHRAYLARFGAGTRRVICLGMNPGPFGMAQTGVPFGEVAAVRDFLGISAPVGRPAREHPRRPVEGFSCRRSEVSGRRLWGLFAARFGTARSFFADHFVANYCPLAFLDSGGRNLTPDKLPPDQTAALFTACDRHLRRLVEVLEPEWLIGVGGFAAARARVALESATLKFGAILHPSPASPAANRDWAGQAARQLEALGVWAARP